MTKPLELLYFLFLTAVVSLWSCIPSHLEVTPSLQVSSPTPSPNLTSIQPSPTVFPTVTPTTASIPSPEIQDSIGIWKSYIGVRGQEDHLIFHMVIEDTSLTPMSIQILDPETGQATDIFPLQVSPFPNLCAAGPRLGKSYYRIEEVYYSDLPPDFWGPTTPFTYLIVLEQSTSEQINVAITERPGSCTNLVE